MSDLPKDPDITIPAPTSEERIQTDREIFDAINKRSGPPARGEATETPEATDAAEPAADEPQDKQQEAPQAPSTDPEVQKARDFLRLKGVPQKAVEGLGDDELVNWRSTVLEREAGIDRAFAERAELRKRLEQLESKDTTEAEQLPPADADFASLTKGFADKFGLDDEADEALAGILKAVVAPLAQRVESLQGEVSTRSQESESAQLESARARLRERFPGLSEAQTFAGVHDTMRALASLPKYQGLPTISERFDALMGDAARIAGVKEETSEAEPDPRTQERAARANGRMTTRSRATPPVGLTPEQRDRRAFDWLQKNPGDKDGAKRHAGLP